MVNIYTVIGPIPLDRCQPPMFRTSEICPSRTTLAVPNCDWSWLWQGRHLVEGTLTRQPHTTLTYSCCHLQETLNTYTTAIS